MKTIISILCSAHFIFALSVYSSRAATIHVPMDQPSIQEGISAALAGDLILVAPGTYVEAIDFLGKAITLRSEEGAAVSVIDGNKANSAVTFDRGEGIETVIDGFTIRNGQAEHGGGILCSTLTSPMITNCSITKNSAAFDGGGIYCDWSSSPTITNCSISENTSVFAGGGVYCWETSSPTITNCSITDSYSFFGGSGLYCYLSSPTITNCVIAENTSVFMGGGIYCDDSSPTITNCTLSGNKSDLSGGGFYCDGSSPTITNCIFWEDSAPSGPEIYVFSGSPSVTYSDVQGGWPGQGNIDANPLFLGAKDYHITFGSPCIDAGTDAGVYTDLDDEVRPRGAGFDIGADEYPECRDGDMDGYGDTACGGYDCDDADPGVNPGAQEICTGGIDEDCNGLIDLDDLDCIIIHVPTDQPTIQDAIDTADSGVLILVAPGTYVENIDFHGKLLTLQSEAGSAVTVIDGNQLGSVMTMSSGETEDTVIEGFTLRNGSGKDDPALGRLGGGIYCCESLPTIKNCILSNNTASRGGGIYCKYSFASIESCSITTNIANHSGGGIHCDWSSSPKITHCTISQNWAGDSGGGIDCDWGSSPTITNCAISSNWAESSGGGVYCNLSSPRITNSTIYGNSTQTYGGGIRCMEAAALTLVNSTVSENWAGMAGGGVYCNDAYVTIANCILWEDSAPMGREIWIGGSSPSTPTVRYSDVQGGRPAVYVWGSAVDWQEGNIDSDPLFVGIDDYHLTPDSPCIDAGDPDPFYADECIPPSMGTERNDMGAYGGPGACDWCWDHDGDGYDSEACGGSDCDDSDPEVYPGAEELCDGKDTDCDGAVPDDEADGDGDGWMLCKDDCDDFNPDINPGVEEACDAIDWDCSGDPLDRDVDGDGHIEDDPVCMGDDCDDTDPDTYSGAPEICDGKDSDCDGTVPDDEADGDGDEWPFCSDCDDADPTVYPGAPDPCDGIDQACDGLSEDADSDQDGHMICEGDCDDSAASVYPGAPDPCDGIDQACDGLDEETDSDEDGTMICEGDCDDSDPTVHPSAPELCDGKDTDCEGTVPDDEADEDGDGWMLCEGDCDDSAASVYPGAPDPCDGVDQACDGLGEEADSDEDGYMTCEGDCDDANPEVNPGVEEICANGIDDDCDGLIDSDEPACVIIHVPSDQPTIQAGIDAAVDENSIWVAPGTYMENINFLGKAITLQSEEGADQTIIDGDQSGSAVQFNSGETVDTIIDGFTIRNGSGTYSDSKYYGGGILCTASSPTITNCTISQNSADIGGGMLYNNSSPTITNCTLSDNRADHHGGGIVCSNSSSTITNCSISGNSAVWGGGISCSYSSSTITECTFSENTADFGGGIYCHESTTAIRGCHITNNSGDDLGGGICCNNASPTIASCTITNNNAGSCSGGIFCYSSSPNITNCTISNNNSDLICGGIAGWESSSPSITNSTISGNTSDFAGGGIYCYASSPIITNSILWGDSAPYGPEIFVYSGSVTVTFSDVQGGWPGQGNIGADPLFLGVSDYHIAMGSPCIDTGTDAGVYTDIDGDARPQGSGFDMGSDEYPDCWDGDMDGFGDTACGGLDCDDANPDVNPSVEEVCDNGVDDDCDGFIDSDDEECVFVHVPGDQSTIQDAIDRAATGGLILVEPGTYIENIDFLGKAVTVRGEAGPDTTVIDGNQQGPVVTFSNAETEEAVLQGFTLRNGSGEYDPLLGGLSGGGIHCYESFPTIMNCIVSENTASRGGGIYCYFSSPTIKNCSIVRNSASYYGGGIYCDWGSSPAITNCTISVNTADNDGGGISSYFSSPVITNCTISENRAEMRGGGIDCYSSFPIISNSILWGDSAFVGAEIWVGGYFPSTITIRHSDVQGGEAGLYIDPSCILNWLEGNIDSEPIFVGGGDYHLTAGSPCVDAGNPASLYNDVCLPPSMGSERNDMGAYGGPGACDWCWDHDGDGYDSETCGGTDCDDLDPEVYPDAEEICDGMDTNCDGQIDEGFVDADGDGSAFCMDCNDSDPAVYPGAPDPCDGIDQACDGLADEIDSDEDGFMVCEDDCDDGDPAVWPSALEICDGKDSDCDGTFPDDEVDGDGDDWRICEGDCDDSIPAVYPGAPDPCDGVDQACDGLGDEVDSDEDGFMVCEGDCDDSDPAVWPSAPELCDGEDSDCDGTIPDDEIDGDGDGWFVCTGDCDDGDPAVWPSAPEICDGVDNDCDGTVPDDEIDGDGDGWKICEDDCDDLNPEVNPWADEICEGSIDDDCDGLIDTDDPECGIIHVPGVMPTIQDAVDMALDGNQVLVSSGTYMENIDFLGKAITLRSDAGAEVTVIDGSRSGSVVTFNNGEDMDAVLDGFTIRNGDAELGGGIYCASFTSPMITDCTIIENSALLGGGGVYCEGSSPVITRCTISGNVGYILGGGIDCEGASPTVTNCMISENRSLFGGGIYAWESSSPVITNCTLSGNSADFSGGGIYFDDSSPVVTNCVLWDDTAPDSPEIDVPSGSVSVTYSDVQGGWPGEGNIDIDPLFVGEGDYHIPIGSPCIDSGTDAGVYVDIDGDSRPQGAGFDMGADEYPDCRDEDMDGYGDTACGGYDCDDADPAVNPGAQEVCTGGIDDDCDGLVDSDDPECMIIHVPADEPTIQYAIDAADDEALVLVAPGTYVENIDFYGKAITVRSEMGPDLTVIDGNQQGPVVRFSTEETEAAVLEGFTLRNGSGEYTPGLGDLGGGIYCNISSPTVKNCILTENFTPRGGGIYLVNSSASIEDCSIEGNSASESGGGIYCDWGASPTISNCTIAGNQAETYGAGMYCDFTSAPAIINCTIKGNSAGSSGGGLFCADFSSPAITNCTISGNSAGSSGGGIYGVTSILTVTNCILWDDSALEGPELWVGGYLPTTGTIRFSDIQGGEAAVHVEPGCSLDWMEGNIDSDPLFVGGGDYHLTDGSPCIDAGADAGVYTDRDGDVRPQGAGFDMGSDEFSPGKSSAYFCTSRKLNRNGTTVLSLK